MDGRQTIRASDHDRQEVVDRLRGAVQDGRLQMDEFVDRVGRAYQALTYGDLAPLYADLPAEGSRQQVAPPVPAAPAAAAPAGRLRPDRPPVRWSAPSGGQDREGRAALSGPLRLGPRIGPGTRRPIGPG
jgi:Domain of unknown function (DUF1707)